MVRVEFIKDEDGAVLTFDGEYEVVLSPEAFSAFAAKMESATTTREIRGVYVFDPDDEE